MQTFAAYKIHLFVSGSSQLLIPEMLSNQRLYHLLVTRREYKLVKRSLTLALAVFFRMHIDNICKIEGRYYSELARTSTQIP